MYSRKVRVTILIPYGLRIEAKNLGISISKVTTDALKNAIDAKKLELIE